MKAAELLRLYEVGQRDFRGENLRGQNFEGKKLAEVDFSGVHIRSTNFTNANLSGASFAQAQAGLQRRWTIGLMVAVFLSAWLAGFLSTFAFYFVTQISKFTNQWEGIPFNHHGVDWLALVFIAVFLLLFIRGSTQAVTPFIVGIVLALLLAFIGSIAGTVSVVLAVFGTLVGTVAVTIAVTVAGPTVGSLTFAIGFYVAVAVTVNFAITVTIAITGSAGMPVSESINETFGLSGVIMLVSVFVSKFGLQGDGQYLWVRSVAIAIAGSVGTSFRGAILNDADFSQARLKGTDLRWTSQMHTNWHDAIELEQTRRGGTILVEPVVQELLATRKGAEKSYTGCNLNGANLLKVDLRNADLTDANLNNATLEGACLDRANFTRTQALGTNFSKARLTGACIEAWNIDSATQLREVDCKYIYLLSSQKERRPSAEESIFAPGEFTSLFEEALNTIDLIFQDGVDWQAFFQAFQKLRAQYDDTNLSIQAIERKRDGAFVIRLEIPLEGGDEAEIESQAKQLYELELKKLEAQYEKQLRLLGEYNAEEKQRLIEAERQEKATLMGIIKTLANSQGTIYQFNNSKFGGGFAAEGGFQIAGTLNDLSQANDLTEVNNKIQGLLAQLRSETDSENAAQEKAAKALATQAQNDSTFMWKLVNFGKALGADASKAATNTAVKIIIAKALEMLGVPLI